MSCYMLFVKEIKSEYCTQKLAKFFHVAYDKKQEGLVLSSCSLFISMDG